MIRVYGAFAIRSLRYQRVPEAELDDALQDVFIVVARRLSEYRESGRGRAWIYSICTRVASDFRRRHNRRRALLLAAISDRDHPPKQIDGMMAWEAARFGQQLLALLPPSQREVFVLYEVEDLTIQEVAKAIGCPIQTAYSRLRRARAKVAAEIERLSG